MRKPVSEHDITLKSRRRTKPRADEPPRRPMEPVHEGGRIRRIIFSDDTPVEAGPEPEPEPQPEPVTESPPEVLRDSPREPVAEPRPSSRDAGYRLRHRASMEEIHRDVDDRILGRPRTNGMGREIHRRRESTVYRTGRGEVRSSEYETREGRRRALYISREDQGVPRERRFVGSEVDRAIEDLPDRGPQDVVAAPTRPGPVEEPARTAWYGYKGDVHPVVEIEGIGPVYMDRLNDLGIETTDRLCYEDTKTLAKRLGVPEKTVASWKAMAELVKVNGIGPQYAEALARTGIHGIQSLKDRSPAKVADEVNAYLDSLDSTVIKTRLTEKRVETWQKAAKKMRRVRRSPPES